MSLHALLQVIRDSGDTKINEIEANAYAQAREITTNALLEAESIKEQACNKAMGPAARERARLIQRARLDALRTTGEVRESLVDAALEQCHGRLAWIRSESIYPQVLCQVLRETLAELEKSLKGSVLTNQAFIEADPRDKEALEGLLTEMELKLKVNYNLTCWGGLTARSEDGRVAVINTLEVRLDRATPFLRRYLAALFENRNSETKKKEVFERKVFA
jgi:vacuolar-type H+-ATPase subunit E/Vma4